jgi:hypothetical protein
MKRAIVALLIIVIFVNFVFIILRAQALGPENNFFNTRLREKFARVEFLRHVLGLHYDGDGKSDYLSHKYSKIFIEVDSMDGLQVPDASLKLLAEKISDITGKPTTYAVSNTHIPYVSVLTEGQISDTVNQNRNYKNHDDTAVLYLLYVSKVSDDVQEVGSSYEESGILLFDSVLVDFTSSNPSTFNNYVESTALHEFGHQLGLPHNNYSDCLMQASVDMGYNGYTTPAGVIVDFCDYEKDLIKNNNY